MKQILRSFYHQDAIHIVKQELFIGMQQRTDLLSLLEESWQILVQVLSETLCSLLTE